MRTRAQAVPPRRRRLSVDERRALLLELGMRLFGARGLDEVSVEDIAREAGVSSGLLYHYFGSKREFHREVTAHAFARLTAVTAPDYARPPGERLVDGLVRYLQYLRADTLGWYWLLRGGGSVDEQMWALGEGYRATIEGWVFEALPDDARTPLARLAVRGWIGSNAEIALVWLEPGSPPLPDVVRLMVSALVAALSAAGIDPGTLDRLAADAEPALTELG